MSDVLHVRLGSPDNPVDLGLVEQLAEHLRGAYRELVQERGGSRVHVRFEVTNATKGSLILDLVPQLTGDDLPETTEVTQALINDIESLALDQPRPTMGSGLLNQYRALVDIAQKAGRLEVGHDASSTAIGPENQIVFEAALKESPEPDTLVVGAIETVNIHRRPWTFGLYSKLDRERIECRFEEHLLETVLALMEEKAVVEVIGEGRFGPAGVTPRQIEVVEVPRKIVADADRLRAFRRSLDLQTVRMDAAEAGGGRSAVG